MPARRLTPRRQSRQAGFTLVEVLVAMAILAIALGASLRLISQQTRVTAALEDRVFAHWVALNTLEERRLGLSAPSGASGVDMGGARWDVETQDEPGPAGLIRVEIRVRSDGRAGAVLVGYLRPPEAPE